jgi:hypothetical protein
MSARHLTFGAGEQELNCRGEMSTDSNTRLKSLSWGASYCLWQVIPLCGSADFFVPLTAALFLRCRRSRAAKL